MFGVILLSDLILYILTSSIFFAFFLQQIRRQGKGTDAIQGHQRESVSKAVREINVLPSEHELVRTLQRLINFDGAGSWPPLVTYDSTWPDVLRPYHELYLSLAPNLSSIIVSTDDTINLSRVQEFRCRMRQLLKEKVDIVLAKKFFEDYERNEEPLIPGHALNGFLACIASCRHAFRWGTIPVVKIAQQEETIDLPIELLVPWSFLCQRYGFRAASGNITSNYLCNFDNQQKLMYKINHAMPKEIQQTEHHFAHLFLAMESFGTTIYSHLARAVLSYSHGEKHQVILLLKATTEILREALKFYYDTMIDSKISKINWMPYAQGFQGWGVGDVIDEVYVKYDGLSGNQALLFQVIDAFLGLPPYLDDTQSRYYIPKTQRDLLNTFRKYNFRQQAIDNHDVDVCFYMDKIVHQMRTFRAAHRARAGQYLSSPRPERFIMTAGKSVMESPTITNIKTAIAYLDTFLVKRLEQTR